MVLEDEVTNARKRVSRDGYDMSFGELASLYERGEKYLFSQNTSVCAYGTKHKKRDFIEFVLLNIPIPPIFVFADKNGKWELVDGLQRVATILESIGTLKEPDGKEVEPFICEGTSLLPSLAGMRWKAGEGGDATQLPEKLQVYLKVQESE